MNLDPTATAKHRQQKISQIKRWAVPVLLLAGLYNILWGAWVVLFPLSFFDLLGLTHPIYPQFWQCIGMIVGVYGVGYIAAATSPLRHWPIVLVGLMGKIFGPIGFLDAVSRGDFPLSFGWMILFNDLIWWVPFGALLYYTWKANKENWFSEPLQKRSLKHVLDHFKTSQNKTLLQHSYESPVLLVFLRHSGCTFCREALADISAARAKIEASGVLPILVDMMGDDRESKAFYQQYRLADLPRVHDSSRQLYRSLGLKRGSLLQLFGPAVWVSGFRAGVLEGHGVGWLKGDGLQMPGIFLIHQGKILAAQKHRSAAERPNYEAFACSVERPKAAN